MIEWRMRAEDVIRIRFAFSPLMELVLSLMALRAPREHSAHLPWVRATRPLVAGLDLAEVYALVPVHGWMADFISFGEDGAVADAERVGVRPAR